MSAPKTEVASRTPLAAVPFLHRSHGLLQVQQIVFFQDPQGRIMRTGGSGDRLVVDLDKNPSMNTGFAATIWNNDINSDTQMRVYYTDNEGKIYERAYTKSRGPQWYDGALTGQFKAAPNSRLGALGSENGNLTWVYFQDPETDEIRSLFRSGSGAGFNLTSVRFPAGHKGTSIAAGMSKMNGIFYQLPDLSITHQDGLPQAEKFKTQLDHPAGASIAIAGNIVFTVTSSNKVAATEYNTTTNKWKPSIELLSVQQLAPLAANSHEIATGATNSISALTQRSEHDLALIEFTSVKDIVVSTVTV